MPEVSSVAAGRIVGTNDETIRRHVKRGLLAARQEGLRGKLRIDIDELRRYATKYQYRFDEKLASELVRN